MTVCLRTNYARLLYSLTTSDILKTLSVISQIYRGKSWGRVMTLDLTGLML